MKGEIRLFSTAAALQVLPLPYPFAKKIWSLQLSSHYVKCSVIGQAERQGGKCSLQMTACCVGYLYKSQKYSDTYTIGT